MGFFFLKEKHGRIAEEIRTRAVLSTCFPKSLAALSNIRGLTVLAQGLVLSNSEFVPLYKATFIGTLSVFGCCLYASPLTSLGVLVRHLYRC